MFISSIFFICCFVVEKQNLMRLSWFLGVDGGFDNNEIEYEDTYGIVILPDYVTLPFPSVELPEKVLISILFLVFE